LLQGLLRRGVDDFREQAVIGVEGGQLHIRRDELPLKAVALRGILAGPPFVHQVDVAILTDFVAHVISPPISNTFSISVNAELVASTISLNLLAGKLSSWAKYSSFQSPMTT
jgi:hypothetical protein